MPALDALRDEIRKHYLADEDLLLRRLIESAEISSTRREAISAKAAELVRAVRASSTRHLMESFLAEYGLSTSEGVALM